MRHFLLARWPFRRICTATSYCGWCGVEGASWALKAVSDASTFQPWLSNGANLLQGPQHQLSCSGDCHTAEIIEAYMLMISPSTYQTFCLWLEAVERSFPDLVLR